MKTITEYVSDNPVIKIKSSYKELYNYIRRSMPLGIKWVVKGGKHDRLYFWFYGNKYQGNQLCWSNMN